MTRIRAIIYVTRLPPSPSGVALYAESFKQVLETVAPTDVVRLPSAPGDSQRVGTLMTTLGRVVRDVCRDRDCVVYIELAGRGLAEFWTGYFLTRRPWLRRVWLTLHDAPSVCGGAFSFRLLDRRGGRRLAERLSRTIGRRAERSLLQDAERVYCLSEAGVRLVSSAHDLKRPVGRLPHVAVASGTPVEGRTSILFPGYIDGLENISPVLRALSRIAPLWRAEIGACGERTADDTMRFAREIGIETRVRMLGYLEEAQLREAFERAAIVVRWRSSGWARNGSPGSAAVSGSLIRAMACGAAIVTNDSRGIGESLSNACALRLPNGDAGAQLLEESLVALAGDPARRATMAAAGREQILREHDPSRIARQLVEE